MRNAPLFVLLVIAGCVTQPKPFTPPGIVANIVCDPRTYGYSQRYPRVALSDTTAYVETSLGVTEHEIQSREVKGTDVEYVWPTGGTDIVILSIGANGSGQMYSYNPRIVKEANAQMSFLYFASATRAGTTLTCRKAW